MRTTVYTSEKYPGKMFATEVCLNDLMKGIPGNRKRKRWVCEKFFELMTNDLIDNNDFFIFPTEKFGYLTIANRNNPLAENYVFDLENNGVIYRPYIWGKGVQYFIKKKLLYYVVDFIGKTGAYFKKAVNSGHKY